MPDGSDQLDAATRRARMLAVIEGVSFARVTDLSERFGVSTVTVRGDLESLEADGAVTRIRGGAMPVRGVRERPFEQTQIDAAEQKARIARAAVDQLGSGMSVMIDVGTTTSAIARELVARSELRDLTVVTNGLTIALELEQVLDRVSVVVTGGTLRQLQHSLVPPLADGLLGRVHADVAFIGCTGVDGEVGVTNINLPESEMKRAMAAAASRVIVVADSSKLGRVHIGRVVETSAVDALITGKDAPRSVIASLRANGLKHITTV
ncbi:DeoR/GlpR family DNA-binding transcription regulator [Gryllotalpicola koreensis]|uniref:DeoR/GlpR family DNA-binding transcription regulator n=1 Tax=Gryllotalpicola koreensis TaxID=993086 RepID=A0ABP8A412_9MICO